MTQNVLKNHPNADRPELDSYGYWLSAFIQIKVHVYTSFVVFFYNIGALFLHPYSKTDVITNNARSYG
jgi:hypothetical protein